MDQAPNVDSPPTSPPANTPDAPPGRPSSKPQLPKPPSFRPGDRSQAGQNMTQSSTPLGNLNAARRPALPQNASAAARGSQLTQDVQARMRAFHLSRQGPPPPQAPAAPVRSDAASPNKPGFSQGGPLPKEIESPQSVSGSVASPILSPAGGPSLTSLSPGDRPTPTNFKSAPTLNNVSIKPAKGLAAKRGLKTAMKLSDATGPPPAAPKDLRDTPVEVEAREEKPEGQANSLFNKYAQYVDTATGTLNFKGKATIHGQGIDFQGGTSFSISLDEVDTLDELGKGNYGTVYKVRHSRPKIRKPGQGLDGNRLRTSAAPALSSEDSGRTDSAPSSGQTSGVVMAMKEIRLELDDAKFAAIIMELDILHRCISPFIVDFYGAFFQEGAVYVCMEFMDGGSIDKLYGHGVPEPVLRKITLSTILGLKALKDEHNIIHRDVKPTNILVNTKGQVKICDFGVSGNLVASIAKTNIGCQSYMAPERISGGGMAQAGANPGGGTYSVQSDIWSLGLTIIECGMGQYPYPPETYDNIFSQLSAIVDGDPPDLPADKFSETARDFVRGALHKIPKLRPTYAMLLRHPWISRLLKPPAILEDDDGNTAGGANQDEVSEPGLVDSEVASWAKEAIASRAANGNDRPQKAPALHAAVLAPP